MKNAKYEYIAFLDADDYYLPGRFSTAQKIFEDDPTCEGVYEAIGMHVEDETALQRWREAGKPEDTLKTIKEFIEPGNLGESLIKGGKGHFSLDGFTIRKMVLNKSGLMDESLRIHQDTNFIIRVALVSRLLPGTLDRPVTMWRVHQSNRVSAPRSLAQDYRNRMVFWISLYHWSEENSNPDIQKMILESIVKYTRSQKVIKNFPVKFFPTRIIWGVRLLRLIGYPEVLLNLTKRNKNS